MRAPQFWRQCLVAVALVAIAGLMGPPARSYASCPSFIQRTFQVGNHTQTWTLTFVSCQIINGNTVVVYNLTSPDASSEQISHFVIGACDQLQQAFLSVKPNKPVELGTDPTTGLNGVSVSNAGTGEYQLTFKGVWTCGCTQAALKQANDQSQFTPGPIQGIESPDCTQGTNGCTPTISCPADITVSNESGQCGAHVTYSAPTVGGSCTGVTVACSPMSGSFFPVGRTKVTCTATSGTGQMVSCYFYVTVNDTEKPTITCPSDINVNAASGATSAPVTFTVTASDNCPGVTVVCKNQNNQVVHSGDSFPCGVTTVTCTATDAAGNTNQCSFKITVSCVSGIGGALMITCPPDVTLCAGSGSCGATTTINPTVSGGTGNVTVTCTAPIGPGGSVVTVTSNTVFPFGTTTVTCTAMDQAGDTAHCMQHVTVLPSGSFTPKMYVAAINGVPTTGMPDQVTLNVGDCITLKLLLTIPGCSGVFDATSFTTFTTGVPARGTFTAANVWCATAAEANHEFPIYGQFFNSCKGTTTTSTVSVTVRP